MGLIRATMNAIGGSLADAWLEVFEADDMSDSTVFTKGVAVRTDKRNSNKKGNSEIVTNGSVVHVYPGQFMMLVDGGKVVDYTAEPGYYEVDDQGAPSLLAGNFGDSLKDAFNRIRFGGTPSMGQKVYFVNLQEIKGIKFGTRNPVNYFDNFYNAELFLRAYGTYSIKITNPLLFYTEVIPKNEDKVEINSINEQYLYEFLEALQAAINKMSTDGIRISHVTSKARELSSYMATELDEEWKKTRGFEVQAVGIASVSYDEESKALINERNKGAMLSDPSVREGYVQGAIARGLESAGSNEGGAAQAFMGMGFGMNGAGGFMNAASETNRMGMKEQRQEADRRREEDNNAWTCSCGQKNTGKFCTECGKKKPQPQAEEGAFWICSCGQKNTGKFCTECGKKKPETENWFCPDCGHQNTGKFCTECGKKKP